MKLKNKVLSVFLLSLPFCASALSLGEIRGVAWVGQALDLRVAVQLDESSRSDSSCFDVEVSYGELQQPAASVRVSLESPPQTAVSTIRIQSLNPVNEPVVSINLKAVCSAKTARRYVILADLPVNPASNTSAIGVALSTSAITSHQVFSSVSSDSALSAIVAPIPRARTQSQILNRQSLVQPSARRPDNFRKSSAQSATRTPSGKSRLSLDPLEPLELRFERIQQKLLIHSTPIQLPELPADVLTQSLTQTLDAQSFKKLEEDVLSMQAQVIKSDQSMLMLRERLKQAESERYDNGFVYALLVFLIATLAYLAYLLRRQSQANSMIAEAWFESADAAHTKPVKVVPVQSQPAPVVQVDAVNVSEAAKSTDFSHVDLDNLLPFPQAVGAVPELADEITETLKNKSMNGSEKKSQINKPITKTDPRQHADFLVSLGQTEVAIEILNSAIHDDEKINPMLYLDLLKIYHSMGMRDDFRVLSDRFGQLFKARVPDYAGFRSEGKDLTSYEEVVAQISFYWFSPQVVDVINTFIYADPSAENEEIVDLQAFRDLLLLRAVAQSQSDSPHTQEQLGHQKQSVIWQV